MSRINAAIAQAASNVLPPLHLAEAGDGDIPGGDSEMPGEELPVVDDGQQAEEGEPGDEVARLRTQVEQNTTLTNLLADPNIQAYLAARQNGQPVRLAAIEQPGPGAPAEEQFEEPADWESLTNQQLADIGAKKTLSLVRSALGEVLGPIQEQLNQLREVGTEVAQDKTTREIERVESKYKDFKAYGPQIVALHKQHPTLKVEQLYLLARSERQAVLPTDRRRAGTGAERPSSLRPALRPAPAAQEKLNGRAGMTRILEDHFNR